MILAYALLGALVAIEVVSAGISWLLRLFTAVAR